MFSVTPIAFRMKKAINMESGIAIPTNAAFLNPKKNNSTPTTSMVPNMIEFSNSST